MLIFFDNVLFNYKPLNNDGNKWLLLDTNKKIKTSFLHIQQVPKAQNKQKKSSKKWFG